MVSSRPNRNLSRAVVVALLLLAFADVARISARAGQQAQPPPAATFRTQVNLVQVDAVILDQQGRFVPDLRQEDFEILEDGKGQRIVSADLVNIPIERVEAPLFVVGHPIRPDVRSNERPFDGRLYLIVLDDLQTNASRSLVARRIAREFIEKNVAVGDLAAVVTTSGNRKMAQEFTSDRSLLLQAVETFVGAKVASPGSEALALSSTPEAATPTMSVSERVANAKASLRTITDLATFAGRIRNRRKAVVLISEGIDFAPGRSFDVANSSGLELRDHLRDFVAAANRANVTLYAFDPRVYTHGMDEFTDIASGTPDMVDSQGYEINKGTKIGDDLRVSQDNLRVMATETGGFAVTGSPMALAQGFERVRMENSNYYMLGYYGSNEARDGRFRKIEVRVKRPGLKVVARRGYTAPKGSAVAVPAITTKEGTSPAVRDALASVLPVTGLTLRASAVPFKGIGSNASVVVIVQIGGGDLTFTPKGERFEDSVELSVVAVDKVGKTRGGERFELDMPLTQKTQAVVAQSGLVFQMRLELPPGQYQLRIAGRDAGSGRVGSVVYDLDVPDFLGAPLTMSGIVLSADEAGQVPNPRPDGELRKLLPASPIATREFAASDELALLAEVYDNQAGRPHTVSIVASVQADDGRVILSRNDERSSAELSGASGAYGYTTKIPLRDFGPGLYVLTLSARSTLTPDLAASREIQFRVR